MIGLCTDSNAQLPAELVERYGVEVVPLTVTLDGHDFLEGVDLDADGFYARFEQGVTQVATAAPSPGRFLLAYEALVARGATEIISIHIGSSVSSTLDAALVASRGAGVPVRLVDSGSASFAIGCCVWEAAEALTKGADAEAAALVAEAVAARTGNVFVVGALELARSGGRLRESPFGGVTAIPVLTLAEGRMVPVGEVATMEDAARVMATTVLGAGTDLRVGLGIADAGAAPLWHALEEALVDAPEVLEVVRYRIGPSVGAHTGPGSAGAIYYPSTV
ncbi:MAG TPA: DegV family protein [Acidimicrobiales bacterium]